VSACRTECSRGKDSTCPLRCERQREALDAYSRCRNEGRRANECAEYCRAEPVFRPPPAPSALSAQLQMCLVE
jgi:hypothetical protein